ncbi:MAG TPA: hypothetical protein VNS49_13935, partial [Streptomyces sp.]|nr:hypothetical protein [Streptomyces sp.]
GSVMNAAYAPGVRNVPGVPAAAGGDAGHSLGEAYGIASRLGGSAGEALRSAARNAFVHGMHVTLIVSAVLLLLGALAALRLPRTMETARDEVDAAAEADVAAEADEERPAAGEVPAEEAPVEKTPEGATVDGKFTESTSRTPAGSAAQSGPAAHSERGSAHNGLPRQAEWSRGRSEAAAPAEPGHGDGDLLPSGITRP